MLLITLNKLALPTGSVLQVVSSQYSTETSSTSTTIIDTGLETDSIGPQELGDWIGDIMGDSPFHPDCYLLKKKPELNRQNTIHSKAKTFFIRCYWYWVVFCGCGSSKYNGSGEAGY